MYIKWIHYFQRMIFFFFFNLKSKRFPSQTWLNEHLTFAGYRVHVLYERAAFSSRGPTLCSGRWVGDYVLSERGWGLGLQAVCVSACVQERRARDARIKKRLVEIKALP